MPECDHKLNVVCGMPNIVLLTLQAQQYIFIDRQGDREINNKLV